MSIMRENDEYGSFFRSVSPITLLQDYHLAKDDTLMKRMQRFPVSSTEIGGFYQPSAPIPDPPRPFFSRNHQRITGDATDPLKAPWMERPPSSPRWRPPRAPQYSLPPQPRHHIREEPQRYTDERPGDEVYRHRTRSEQRFSDPQHDRYGQPYRSHDYNPYRDRQPIAPRRSLQIEAEDNRGREYYRTPQCRSHEQGAGYEPYRRPQPSYKRPYSMDLSEEMMRRSPDKDYWDRYYAHRNGGTLLPDIRTDIEPYRRDDYPGVHPSYLV